VTDATNFERSLAGTAIPRWTLAPTQGVVRLDLPVPAELATELSTVARELGVPVHSTLLAAHAKVLAAVSGDTEVSLGYVVVPGGRQLPCRIAVAPGAWRDLVAGARAVERALLDPHRDVPKAAATPADGHAAVFHVSGDMDALPDCAALHIGMTRHGDRLVLQVSCSTETLDADSVLRIAGYHVAALELIAKDPDADHRHSCLLSADEIRMQLEGFAGPVRELPDRRVHEIFEERVRVHPCAVAAVHGARTWTYADLNSRANRLGRALLARGIHAEDVVAVVSERSLDWLAAVLGVFKAGGVYLPVEPTLPANRVAAMLARAGCTTVVTEVRGSNTLEEAVGSVRGMQTLTFGAAYDDSISDGDLAVPVAADQLAYVYFTSGSTGEPKGAMCEHAGLLNHLYAKVDDLGITEGDVVAQTAAQGFDISLWQLLSGLLVGGRTHVVEPEVILDVGRFVEEVVDARVSVLQVVPSYLDVVLSHLEQHPRRFKDLRCLSVTGETLDVDLARRWFAAQPHVALVNAYGLTETSDDTNHEVMAEPPDGERVPLGRAVNNVRVYVVDERMALVPFGAPGEIVFSGVCVGRGYVNDPDGTRRAFGADPYRPGERLYRSGDNGRWRPDGKLEFLGRRDSQVKMSGRRIEIGEVESALSRAADVGRCAVVVGEPAGRSRQLVAFYSGDRPVDVDVLRQHLWRSLPAYMVPSVFHWRRMLPVTANGKTDRAALAAEASRPSPPSPDGTATPRRPAEQRLAVEWSRVLGVPADEIDRWDDFFDRGGTSLAALQLVIILGRQVSLEDVTRHPVLADLALLLDGSSVSPTGSPHQPTLTCSNGSRA
jgi:amino acid adenylation domain-containing protein